MYSTRRLCVLGWSGLRPSYIPFGQDWHIKIMYSSAHFRKPLKYCCFLDTCTYCTVWFPSLYPHGYQNVEPNSWANLERREWTSFLISTCSNLKAVHLESIKPYAENKAEALKSLICNWLERFERLIQPPSFLSKSMPQPWSIRWCSSTSWSIFPTMFWRYHSIRDLVLLNCA